MFQIVSKQDITWSWVGLRLEVGTNEFSSRREVHSKSWPMLLHFRELGVLSFDGDADTPEPVNVPAEE